MKRYNSYGQLVETEKYFFCDESLRMDENKKKYLFGKFNDQTDNMILMSREVSEKESDYFEFYWEEPFWLNITWENETQCKELRLNFNIVDMVFSSFRLEILLKEKNKRFTISEKEYIEKEIEDDVFHPLIQRLFEKENFKEYNYEANEKNEYLDGVEMSPSNSEFWEIYNAFKKEFKQSHYKNNHIFFDNTECVVNHDRIYFNEKIYDVSDFLKTYAKKKGQEHE